MAVTVDVKESFPSEYPAAPDGLSTAAAGLLTVAWQRIESYIAHRFTPREVAFYCQGPGEWHPKLEPFTLTKAEIWCKGVWEEITPPDTPLGGYWLASFGPWKFSGRVGDDDADVPAIVNEAVKRLTEYLASDPGQAGASSERVDITDIESRSVSRSPSWMAKALQNSGAADLLRGFRNV